METGEEVVALTVVGGGDKEEREAGEKVVA
jgi:hypothetical protein